MSITGARVVIPESEAPTTDKPLLVLVMGGDRIELLTRVRRRVPRAEGALELGLEFDGGQQPELVRLVVALFQSGYAFGAREAAAPAGAVWDNVA